jgi:hypothetical protein
MREEREGREDGDLDIHFMIDKIRYLKKNILQSEVGEERGLEANGEGRAWGRNLERRFGLL